MAKPKIKVMVSPPLDSLRFLDIWCDNPYQVLSDIASIEGVLDVRYSTGLLRITAECDPRYDRDEIAQEIRDLLLSEVPEVFKE